MQWSGGLIGLASILITVFQFNPWRVWAANGCGGSAECQDDTRVKVTNSCRVTGVGICETGDTFQSYVCQQIDQDHCDGWTFVDNYICTGLGECHYNVKKVTFSCCGSGGGGGGTCPPGQYWRTVKECRQACNAGWVPAGGIRSLISPPAPSSPVFSNRGNPTARARRVTPPRPECETTSSIFPSGGLQNKSGTR